MVIYSNKISLLENLRYKEIKLSGIGYRMFNVPQKYSVFNVGYSHGVCFINKVVGRRQRMMVDDVHVYCRIRRIDPYRQRGIIHGSLPAAKEGKKR